MSNSNNQRYSNVHTEGMGYVSNWKEHGDFTTVTFCMLEGAGSNIDQLYVSLTLSSDEAEKLLKPYREEISNRDVTVFAGFRLAKYRATPFVYPQTSAKAGQLGVNYSARLIKVMYLKVGDLVVSLPKDKTEASTDYHLQLSNDSDGKNVGKRYQSEQDAVSNEPLFPVPLVVRLSQDDPNFKETKARLKENGYRWHSELQVWVVPQVELDPHEGRLVAKRQELTNLGYSNDVARDGLTWRMTFGQPKQAKTANTSTGGVVTSTAVANDLPTVVKLSKDDPNFETIKAQLKKDGYKWDNDQKSWMLAAVC